MQGRGAEVCCGESGETRAGRARLPFLEKNNRVMIGVLSSPAFRPRPAAAVRGAARRPRQCMSAVYSESALRALRASQKGFASEGGRSPHFFASPDVLDDAGWRADLWCKQSPPASSSLSRPRNYSAGHAMCIMHRSSAPLSRWVCCLDQAAAPETGLAARRQTTRPPEAAAWPPAAVYSSLSLALPPKVRASAFSCA